MPPTLDRIVITVVTVSDRSYKGDRTDTTGPLMTSALEQSGATVTRRVVPDEEAPIRSAIVAAISEGARVVITTGGTGIGPRDATPEATAPLIATALPGIPELLRQRDAHRSPTVALSRGLAGVTEGDPGSVVINVAGSVSAAASAMEVLPNVIAHALAQLDGGDH